jgi:uncharacterized protein YidB (DUF937 family)
MAGMPSSPAVPSAPQFKQPRNPISHKQVEAIISRAIAIAGLVFGAQTVGPLLEQVHDAEPIWLITVVILLSASIIVAIVASIVQRFVRPAHATVAIVYVLALVTWPFAVVHPQSPLVNHWLYYLLTIGTATAAIAFSTRLATIYLFVVPFFYGLIRTTPSGGGAPVLQAALDSIYAIILGGAVMIIVTMLRQAATNVDEAQTMALKRYGHAVRQHATEVERVQVDSIVHDSVLTTLLSAARAHTPEAMDLAAVMAGNAIGHLHEAALMQLDDGTTVRLRIVSKRILDAANAMSESFTVRARDVGPRSIPVAAGEAIYSAAVQAMVNSIQHAGEGQQIARWVTVRGARPDGIEVEIGDAGVGFDLESVANQRLGVRVSILDRVTNAGGSSRIDSAVGQGTVVHLRYPTLTPVIPVEEEGTASPLLSNRDGVSL